MSPNASRTALLAGATGLVGREVLRLLLESPSYRRVIVLARSPLPALSPKLTQLQTDFAELDSFGPNIGADDVYCCLGTTTAKSGKAGLEDVDCRMVLTLAQAARKRGATQFLVVSAVGASATSLAHYSRVKGQMESGVAKVGYPVVHILRPSLLLGARGESRPAEALGQKLAPAISALMIGPLRRYRAITATAVAESMLKLALQPPATGVHIHHLPLEGQ